MKQPLVVYLSRNWKRPWIVLVTYWSFTPGPPKTYHGATVLMSWN
jgi:hypothetical protein